MMIIKLGDYADTRQKTNLAVGNARKISLDSSSSCGISPTILDVVLKINDVDKTGNE